MSNPFKIVIVGGGIGGLSAAIALRKSNREIIVLEQSSLNREIGATISLQPNAWKIAEEQWDLEPLLRNKGLMVDEGFQIYNLEGVLQMRIPLSTKSKYGSERVLFHRVDLHDALKERATSPKYPGSPATIRVSSRVKSCDCEKGEVTLSDGEVITADLVIGADGIKSAIRDSVLEEPVQAKPTGHSAYRVVIPMDELLKEKEFVGVIDPKASLTTMVMGFDRRLIMGPARASTIYSVVAMVPDENMNESSANSSWNTEGDLKKMLEAFEPFPEWAKKPLRLAKEAGLWQLRDLDPLPRWHKGRVILIGDAAHAMLPTQGQGASQSVEDAEALGAFFSSVEDENISSKEIEKINQTIFECRYDRVTTIQGYSRQTAKSALDQEKKVKMSPAQFMDYNCYYNGALDWKSKQDSIRDLEEKTAKVTLEPVSVA